MRMGPVPSMEVFNNVDEGGWVSNSKEVEVEDRIWDFTAIDMFLKCRRKYYYRMVRDLVPLTVAPALDFGKAIHSGLSAYYESGSMPKGISKFEGEYKDREGEVIRTVSNGIKLLENYATVYQHEPFKIIAQEIGFVVPIDKILYGGRLDALVDWDGQLFGLEHKTTSRLVANFFKQFTPNMQISGYAYGAQEYVGKKCYGIIVNALEPWKDLVRPTVKSKKMEDHYARDPVSRSDRELEDFKIEVVAHVYGIVEAELRHEGGMDIKKCFPRTESQCFSYNYGCPYRELCIYGEDERMMQKYKTERWEPYEKAREGNSEQSALA